MDEEKPSGENIRPSKVGLGVGLGLTFGVVLFVLTDQPVWIGVGMALGAGVGASFDKRA